MLVGNAAQTAKPLGSDSPKIPSLWPAAVIRMTGSFADPSSSCAPESQQLLSSAMKIGSFLHMIGRLDPLALSGLGLVCVYACVCVCVEVFPKSWLSAPLYNTD